ncbi:MAG: LptF/LptG family permease [Deferribacteraceae bacterium]|nr:LptF/LptG family permease [Deferribacteraceae bacterium]
MLKYILAEVIPIFIMGNLFFLFILLLQQFVQLADMVLVRNINPLGLIVSIIFLIPSLFSITIPVSTLLAVLLGFNRICADSEYIAFKSCGAGKAAFIFPAVIFGFLAALSALFFSTILLAKGSKLAVDNINSLLENISINDLQERQMYSELKGMILYAGKKIDPSNFENLILINTEDNTIISAQKASIIPNQSSIMLQFEGGFYTVQKDYRFTNIEFERMLVNLPMHIEVQALPTSERFMSMQELKGGFADNLKYRYEYYKRFFMPLSSIPLALLGLSLGVFLSRSGQSLGIFLSCGVALFFNGMFIGGETLAEQGAIPPFLLAVFPVITLTAILIPALKKAL